MKVAVDAHAIGENLAGNGVYTYNLVCSLVRCFPQYEWFLYVSQVGADKLPYDILEIASVVILQSRKALVRYAIEIPKLLLKHKPDIFHFQYHGPFFCNCQMVNMVHDISYDRLPEYFTFNDRLRMKLLCPYFMKRAKKILTVSHFSRNEIINRYGVDENKVVTTYNGVDRSLFYQVKSQEDCKQLNSLGIDNSYLLFVGSLQPRKNIEGLLTALATGVIEKYPDLKMVIVGPQGWLDGGIKKIYSQYPRLNDMVVFTGRVDDDTLRQLYNNCIAVTYIPFYEGFGLPVLEAMACGAPVITSNVTSLPEVGGDAVYYVDPHNQKEIAETICQVVSSESSVRQSMIEKGLRQAMNFSWDETARKTCLVFEGLIDQHGKN